MPSEKVLSNPNLYSSMTPKGGVNLLFGQYFPKTEWKWRKFGPSWKVASPTANELRKLLPIRRTIWTKESNCMKNIQGISPTKWKTKELVLKIPTHAQITFISVTWSLSVLDLCQFCWIFHGTRFSIIPNGVGGSWGTYGFWKKLNLRSP